jgi:hypothetical protein
MSGTFGRAVEILSARGGMSSGPDDEFIDHAASEGGALLVRSRGVLGKMLGVARAKRPKPWLILHFEPPNRQVL